MTQWDFDVAVIGAGVVGLAVAAEVAGRSHRVVVMERHPTFGQEGSSRNSEVIHAGLYYAPGTLKALLCVQGRRRLYEFCERHGVAHRRCGKLVVAVTDAETETLGALHDRGRANGVEGLRMLDARDVRAREPNVSATAALLSPDTGIVDSHGLMAALLAVARRDGADAVFGTCVDDLERRASGWRLGYTDRDGRGTVTARAVVNAAGLGAQRVMRLAGLDPDAEGVTGHLCKGDYFSLQGPRRGMVRGLVYPAPSASAAGLGIHTTVDLGGGLRLGPDAEYVDSLDYTVDPSKRDAFAGAVRGFLPWIEAGDLHPAMAGIRPKLAGPGERARDFHIAVHESAPGLVNLAGIESPGLTACLAIADHVAGLLETSAGDW